MSKNNLKVGDIYQAAGAAFTLLSEMLETSEELERIKFLNTKWQITEINTLQDTVRTFKNELIRISDSINVKNATETGVPIKHTGLPQSILKGDASNVNTPGPSITIRKINYGNPSTKQRTSDKSVFLRKTQSDKYVLNDKIETSDSFLNSDSESDEDMRMLKDEIYDDEYEKTGELSEAFISPSSLNRTLTLNELNATDENDDLLKHLSIVDASF